MTGPEIAMAGKAVEALTGKALTQDSSTKEKILEAAQDTPEMKAAGRALAARAAVKERIKLRLYQPFARLIGVSRAYFEDTFPDEMAVKTINIPDADLITPPPSIAVPALQALSYSFEEPDLKELYLNLLAAASDSRRSGDSHPAFVEIIKQLSTAEVQHLDGVLREGRYVQPITRITEVFEDGSHIIRLDYVLPVTDESGTPVEIPEFPSWIDNWSRLGLVEVDFAAWLAEPKYDWAQRRPELLRLQASASRGRIEFDKGLIRTTPFGERFLRAVAPPDSE